MTAASEVLSSDPADFLSRLSHYEIAFPAQVDESGKFLTYDLRQEPPSYRRSRRSIPEDSERQVFYWLQAQSSNFLLNLTLQTDLLGQHFTVEYWKRGGLDWKHELYEDCHYVGHIQDQQLSSKVAISNCNGLVRTG